MRSTLIPWLLATGLAGQEAPERLPPAKYLEAAIAAGTWLEDTSRPTAAGAWQWRRVPDEAGPVVHDLYSGGAGVVLFFLELYTATDDERWSKNAVRAADGLLAGLDSMFETNRAGLYTGAAGIGMALRYAFEVSKEARFDKGASRCAQWLHVRARKAGKGVEWSPVTDVISGTAGIGQFLIWYHERTGDEDHLVLAKAAGRRLLELAEDAEAGQRWPMRAGYARWMPNYSHGTAGVSAFLAELYQSSSDRAFLQAARAGREHLEGLADERGLIHHHAPGGEDLFYLGWCHGPVGTAMLSERLDRIAGVKWQPAGVEALVKSGLPEKRLPGLWNNVGQCCGTAGIGEYLLLTADPELLPLAERIAADIIARGETVGDGMRWVHSEHRVRPDLLQAQVGYAQGAAGIGLWLLHLYGHLQDRPRLIGLPFRH